MVHEDTSKAKKNKPTGRKNAPRDKSGKFDRKVLAPTGLETIDTGETLINNGRGTIIQVPMDSDFSNPLYQLPKLIMEAVDANFKTPAEIIHDKLDSEKKELDLIDSMEFLNGENKLTIRFSKKHNRMFRIQVFLNDKHEVRPVTYTGSSTGYAFWNLLKGALK